MVHFWKEYRFLFFLIIALILLGSTFILKFKGINKRKLIALESLETIAIIGFISMAVELIILITYQCIFGYLYSKIAILISLFMLGLVIGGKLIHYLDKQGKDLLYLINKLLISYLIIGVFFGIFIFLSNKGLRIELLFYIFSTTFGVVGGSLFPLNILLFNLYSEEPIKSVAYIDSLDHFGAMISSFLVGVFWIPIYGVYMNSIIIIMLIIILFLKWKLIRK